MIEERIVCVGIGEDGRLFVQPDEATFPYIYRTASDVRWDDVRGVLTTNAPRDMSYPNWFRQIWGAAADEYGVDLRLTDETEWVGVPPDVAAEIRQDRARQEAELSRIAARRETMNSDGLDVWAQRRIRSEAAEAFKAGRYREAADLFGEIEAALTRAERQKLAISRKRSSQS